MRLRKIHQQQIDYVNASGVTVETVPIHGHVTISDESGAEIFLQGDEGSEFIAESRRLWRDTGDRTEAECNEIIAYPYCDLLAEIDSEPAHLCAFCNQSPCTAQHFGGY